MEAAKSWRTTLFGIVTGLCLILPQVAAVLDTDPLTTFHLDLFLAGLSAMGIGVAARDNKVTSEQAGAK